MLKDQMEKIYKDLPLDKIPWNMKTPLDTVLYFSSESEIVSLVELFEIKELEIVQIEGKYGPHMAIYAFLKRRNRQ
jgi:hypothetical protein